MSHVALIAGRTIADAVRGRRESTPAATDLALATGWTVGLLVVFVPVSVRLYGRST